MEQRQQQQQVDQDSLAMAAVGRQFMELAVRNESLTNDLKRVVALYNELREEFDAYKLNHLEGEAAKDGLEAE